MKRAKLILLIAAIVASAAFGLTSFQKSLTPYVSFAEAKAASGPVQVSGAVIRPRVKYDAKTGTLTFPLRDQTGAVMTVVSRDGKPNNFDEAPKIVAIGQCANGVFVADHLLTKCPSKYKAEPGKAYRTNPSPTGLGAFAPSGSKPPSGA